MSSNQRHGMRSIDELLEDWIRNTEEKSKENGETLPDSTKKGFSDLRNKIKKPSEAA